MKPETIITQDIVRDTFHYSNGMLIRKEKTQRGGGKAGVPAGSCGGKGYLQTGILGKKYANHRLIWLWHHGYLPENDIDHIDRNKENNKIENLREVSRTCNLRNSSTQKNNTSGIRGVYWCKERNRWSAKISIGGRLVNLGYEKSFSEAVCLRLSAEQAVNWPGCDLFSPSFVYVKNCVHSGYWVEK